MAATPQQSFHDRAHAGQRDAVLSTLARLHWQNSSTPQPYRYDPSGNMTEKRVITDSSEVVETRTYNDLNQITENEIDDGTTVTTWTYTHDANGNMTGKTDGTDTWTYVWDEDNRLVEVQLNSVTQVEYEYDPWNRLVLRIQPTQGIPELRRFEWCGWAMIREVTPTGSLIRYNRPTAQLETLAGRCKSPRSPLPRAPCGHFSWPPAAQPLL